MNKFYHVTDYNNLDSIMSKGLIPQVGERSKLLNEESSIFLFTSNNINEISDSICNWEDFFEDDTRLVLLEIKLPKIHKLSSESCADYEIKSLDKILPKYITIKEDNF